MEVRALDADEAILKAVTVLGYDKTQLKARVVRPSNVKLFGLIKKPGIYNVEYIHKEKPQKAVKRVRQGTEGTIEIIKGIANVTDPTEEGRYASIIAEDPNIDVFINGKQVHGAAIVVSKDEIAIIPKLIEPVTEIHAELSDDRMYATLSIKKIKGKMYFCKDNVCCNSVVIASDYNELPARSAHINQCIQELLKIGVRAEFIDLAAIDRLIGLSDGGCEIVATGVFPVDGIDSKVKYIYDTEENYLQPDETEDRIDLMNHTHIPSVEIGDVLAVKILPAVPGRDGLTVTGDILSAAKGQDIIFKAGQGATILDGGTKAVATSCGRPAYSGNLISVMPLLVVQENIDVRTGNISFEGDIIVRGNVLEGLKVTAKGNIEIFGNVYKARLVADGNIRVSGRVIGSSVMAGANIINYLRNKPNLSQVLEIVKNITTKMEYLSSSIVNSYSRSLIQYITGEKRAIRNLIREIEGSLSMLSDAETNSLMELLDKIKLTLIMINAAGIKDLTTIKILGDEIKQYIRDIDNLHTRYTNVVLQYCQNSQVQSSGRVVITGEGTYLSNLTARDEIIYNKPSSIIRGGILVAGRKIKAGTVGSSAGTHTYCRVLDKDGQIDAVCFYAGTILNINDNITITKST